VLLHVCRSEPIDVPEEQLLPALRALGAPDAIIRRLQLAQPHTTAISMPMLMASGLSTQDVVRVLLEQVLEFRFSVHGILLGPC